jgi:hypothetical protein
MLKALRVAASSSPIRSPARMAVPAEASNELKKTVSPSYLSPWTWMVPFFPIRSCPTGTAAA